VSSPLVTDKRVGFKKRRASIPPVVKYFPFNFNSLPRNGLFETIMGAFGISF
jgi:hypothetical protein